MFDVYLWSWQGNSLLKTTKRPGTRLFLYYTKRNDLVSFSVVETNRHNLFSCQCPGTDTTELACLDTDTNSRILGLWSLGQTTNQRFSSTFGSGVKGDTRNTQEAKKFNIVGPPKRQYLFPYPAPPPKETHQTTVSLKSLKSLRLLPFTNCMGRRIDINFIFSNIFLFHRKITYFTLPPPLSLSHSLSLSLALALLSTGLLTVG